MNFEELKKKYNLKKIQKEKEDLEAEIIKQTSGETKKDIGKLSADLEKKDRIFKKVSELHNKIDAHQQTLEVLNSKDDYEYTKIAQEEKLSLENQIQELEKELKSDLYSDILSDPDDQRSIIMEIRAGAGGDEASLFVDDLFRMYSQYASTKKWDIEIIDSTPNSEGGSKEIIARIIGKDVFKKLKYESGVHRVQRIPSTESSGRIHTSTVSVAVLPEVKDVDINIRPEDIKVDVMRSSGAGGQSVNKIDSAVRITHLPTNIVVSCQETKFQQQNKEKAMNILKSKLYEQEKEKEREKRSSLRLAQIGSAMRAEKIRTYNYPQTRITDHRTKQSWYNLEEILDGKLDGMLDEFHTKMRNLQIEELEKNT